jgi:hypothetical protein
MKTWPLLIGIILLCALISSPVLAISKSDLIAYRSQSAPTTATYQIPSWFSPSLPVSPWKDNSPSVIPPTPNTTPSPTPLGSEALTVRSDPGFAMVYFDGQFKGTSPIILTGLSPGSHQLKLTKFGYSDYNTNVTIYTGGTCRGNIHPYDGCKNWLDTIVLQKAIS